MYAIRSYYVFDGLFQTVKKENTVRKFRQGIMLGLILQQQGFFIKGLGQCFKFVIRTDGTAQDIF